MLFSCPGEVDSPANQALTATVSYSFMLLWWARVQKCLLPTRSTMSKLSLDQGKQSLRSDCLKGKLELKFGKLGLKVFFQSWQSQPAASCYENTGGTVYMSVHWIKQRNGI